MQITNDYLAIKFLTCKTLYIEIYGLFYAMIDCVKRVFVANLTPADIKSTVLGTFHTTLVSLYFSLDF